MFACRVRVRKEWQGLINDPVCVWGEVAGVTGGRGVVCVCTVFGQGRFLQVKKLQ